MQKLAIQILSDKEFSGVVKSNPKYGYVDPDDNLGFADPSEGKVFVRNLHWPELNKWLLTHEIEHILDPSNGTDRDENGIYHKRGIGHFFAQIPKVLGPVGGAVLGNFLLPGLGGVLGGAAGGAAGQVAGRAAEGKSVDFGQAGAGALRGGLSTAGYAAGGGFGPGIGGITGAQTVGAGIGGALGGAAGNALVGKSPLQGALTTGGIAAGLSGLGGTFGSAAQAGGATGGGAFPPVPQGQFTGAGGLSPITAGGATGGGAFPPIPQGTFGGASGLSPVSAGAMGAGAGALGGGGGGGLNAFQLPNAKPSTGYQMLQGGENFNNSLKAGGGQFGMGSPASPMAGAPSTSLGASSNFSMGGGGSQTAPMASQVLRTQGMTQPITPQATPSVTGTGAGAGAGAGGGGAGGGGGGGFHPLQALGRALGIGQGTGSQQAGAAKQAQPGIGQLLKQGLVSGGVGLGIQGLGQLLAPQVNATNQQIPDFGQLPSIQNLRNIAGQGQPISDIAKRATGVLQGRLGQTYGGVPADAQANIQRIFDLERRNTISQVKQMRPDADLATDSRFRDAMQQIDQRQAEATGQLDLQYRQQFQNVQTQDIQTSLGVDTQTLNTLFSLAQLDVATITTRLGVSFQEARDFKQAFSNIGGAVAAQGMGIPSQINTNLGR